MPVSLYGIEEYGFLLAGIHISILIEKSILGLNQQKLKKIKNKFRGKKKKEQIRKKIKVKINDICVYILQLS